MLASNRMACVPSVGTGSTTAQILGKTITVFTYTPGIADPRGVLLVFDGVRRDAPDLRDKAAALAERLALAVFAPLMERETFAKWRYNAAGVVRRGRVRPRGDWTGPLVQGLATWAREQAGSASKPLFLFGHSAGAQLLSRICAYSPLSGTSRILISNPSAYVAPALDIPPPYGFRGIFGAAETLARLQVYLALPITIYLGQQDTSAHNLAQDEQARRQGSHRLERGRHIYIAARELAAQRNWAFNWQLVEAPGVGHSAKGMLDAPQCLDALGMLEKSASPARFPTHEASDNRG